MADNTIVVYFCDNGPNGKRFNAGLKGRKGSVDEGGVRSPLFLRWPEKIAANQTVTTIAGAIDLLPTLAELSSVDLPSQSIDGVSLVPLVAGAPEPDARILPQYDREIFSHWNGRFSVRDARYRLDAKGRVFDLQDDPQQKSPIKDQKVKQRLSDCLQRFENDTVDKKLVLKELMSKEAPFRVGDRSHPNTQLPARDAGSTGQITRSNKYPNSSWFTNWIDVNDYIFWEVDVAVSGQFEVEVYYALDRDDVGVELTLSAAPNSTTAWISSANESPLIGVAEDRSPRKESLMKNFQPVRLGQILLKPGRHTLKLETKTMPGGRSIDFSTLMLKKVAD